MHQDMIWLVILFLVLHIEILCHCLDAYSMNYVIIVVAM